MNDDVETLRDILSCISAASIWASQAKEALAALDRIVADRDSWRKALDDRHEADKKAWRAIMRATGKERGLPDNKEVIAFYVAEVERLEKALKATRSPRRACRGGEMNDDIETLRNFLTYGRGCKEALAALERVEDSLDSYKCQFESEHKIVARIWMQFGNPTYEQLNGRSIYDLIEEVKEERDFLRARMDEAIAWIDGTCCLCDDVCEHAIRDGLDPTLEFCQHHRAHAVLAKLRSVK